MRFLITRDDKGGEAWLSNENCMSRYGICTLEITSVDVNGIFGPADIILSNSERAVTGADIVAGWATQLDTKDEGVQAARRFCAQWSEGPQVP